MKKLSLIAWRHEKGLTQQETADLLGVSRNYIALIENGRKPFSRKMQEKLSLVNMPPPQSVCREDGHFDSHLERRIAELESERDYLREQLATALAALSCMSEPNPTARAPAGHASGVAAPSSIKKHA